jgi:hypothetical protein
MKLACIGNRAGSAAICKALQKRLDELVAKTQGSEVPSDHKISSVEIVGYAVQMKDDD